MAAATLALTRHYQYRKAKNLVMMGLTIFATVITLTPLFLVLGYLLYKGASSINFAFFTRLPAPVGEVGGGMANAIVGTFELVILAAPDGRADRRRRREFMSRSIAAPASPMRSASPPTS